MAHAQTAEITGIEVPPRNITPTPPGADSLEHAGTALNPHLRRLGSTLLFSLVLGLPIWFGGVHAPIFLFERAAILFTTLAFLLFGKARLAETFAPQSFSRWVLTFGAGSISFIAVQSALLALLSPAHPILVSERYLLSYTPGLFEGLFSVITFFALFTVARAWLGRRGEKAERLISTILFSGLIVSLIGLSHWFYDNGRLFWVFEPEHIFTSSRARWPFVNSNHLADFLLPIAFLAIAGIWFNTTELRELTLATQKSNKRSWILLATSRRVQHRLVRLGILLSLLVAIGVCTAAALSRGSWLGAVVGLLVFLLRPLLLKDESAASQNVPLQAAAEANTNGPSGGEGPAEGNWSENPRQARSLKSAWKSLWRMRQQKAFRPRAPHKRRGYISSSEVHGLFDRLARSATPVLIVFSLGLIYFFLYGRGSELFADRLQYGLLFSLEDMRWQLYSDTLPLIRDHMLLGVGLGGWAHTFPQYMSPLLAGIDPVYLHSDPLQLVAELGLLGSALVGAALIVGIVSSVKALRTLEQVRDRASALGLLAGLLGLLVASCLDFPFRIPAITSFAALQLALLAFYVDKRHPRQFSDESDFSSESEFSGR